MKQQIILIKDINTYKGGIPCGYELVEYERGESVENDSLILYGFDEIGSFGFKRPQHAFVNFGGSDGN